MIAHPGAHHSHSLSRNPPESRQHGRPSSPWLRLTVLLRYQAPSPQPAPAPPLLRLLRRPTSRSSSRSRSASSNIVSRSARTIYGNVGGGCCLSMHALCIFAHLDLHMLCTRSTCAPTHPSRFQVRYINALPRPWLLIILSYLLSSRTVLFLIRCASPRCFSTPLQRARCVQSACVNALFVEGFLFVE